MSPSRRLRRRIEKQLRHAQRQPRVVGREAEQVERLTYTRAQAAEALGVSHSTLKRLLPYIALVELPWGTKLIPVDELERLVTERRRQPRERRRSSRSSGRPAVLPPELVERIRAERAAGKSLAQIARDLNASGTPTAHSGRRWWPSTVRAVLARTTVAPLASLQSCRSRGKHAGTSATRFSSAGCRGPAPSTRSRS